MTDGLAGQMAGERIVDLDALHAPFAGAVRVRGRDGVPVVYMVRHIDGGGVHLVRRLEAFMAAKRRGEGITEADAGLDPETSYRLARSYLERVVTEEPLETVPATEDEVNGFTPKQIGAVLAVAQGMIPKVEATIPKSSAPRRRARPTRRGGASRA